MVLWRVKETLHAWRLGPKKRLKRPGARVGCGGRDAENGSQSRSFLPPFHRYIDTSGYYLAKPDSHTSNRADYYKPFLVNYIFRVPIYLEATVFEIESSK